MAIQKEIYLFVNSFLDIKMSKFNWSRASINAQIYMKKNIILFNSDAHGQDSLFYDLGTACPAEELKLLKVVQRDGGGFREQKYGRSHPSRPEPRMPIA